MKKLLFFIAFVSVCLVSAAQKTDKRLQARVAGLLKGFHGDIGVYVHDLKKNRITAINADTVFPTASMVKVANLTGIMQKIESGERTYPKALVVKTSPF